jgi:hypothetical protein
MPEFWASDESRALVAQLPDLLQERLSRHESLLTEQTAMQQVVSQPEGFLGMVQRLWPFSAYRRAVDRLEELDAELEGLDKVTRALLLGYEPYQPPRSWWAGWMQRQPSAANRITVDGQTGVDIRLSFRATLPAPVREKYQDAQATGLFQEFVVAAPDRELFEEIRSPKQDPVLIGYVKTEATPLKILHPTEGPSWYRRITPGVLVEGGCGFLIAAWDYAGDRASSHLNF